MPYKGTITPRKYTSGDEGDCRNMKSITFIFICALFQSLVCTSLAFPASKLTRKKYHHQRSTLQQWRASGNEKKDNVRIRVSSLHLSKYRENIIEEEYITKSPPTTNDSTDLHGERIEDSSVSSDINGNANGELLNVDISQNNDRALGILVLLTVPLAWGTYTPVVKYMYEKMDPSMPGFVFSAGYYLVAATSLGILSYMQDNSNDADASDENGVVSETMPDDELTSDQKETDDAEITKRGGWELGGYLFIGNGLQVVGLQTVPADRAAFLVQLTTVMVPLVSALTAGTISAVPLQTWIACIIAFAGVIIMGADDGGNSDVDTISSDNIVDASNSIEGALSTSLGEQSTSIFSGLIDFDQLSTSLQMSQGDFLIVLAALAYTMHVVRLGVYAPRTTPLKLAASKATTEAIFSVLVVIALAFIGSTHVPSPEFVSQTGSSVSEYFTTITSRLVEGGLASKANESSLGVSIAAILWTGWVTCAYTIYAQSFGQRRVNPTDSNLIYTTQPLFSSLFAYFLLGETLGFYGYVGAALIGTALWLVSSSLEAE